MNRIPGADTRADSISARGDKVARVCDICGKRRGVGNNVSHANNKTKRTWQPNIQAVHAVVDGSPRRIKACTRCIRSGKVTKAA